MPSMENVAPKQCNANRNKIKQTNQSLRESETFLVILVNLQNTDNWNVMKKFLAA